MKIVGDKMTAGELKERVLKKPFRGCNVIGKLDAVVKGGHDSFCHIHSDEQIPVNVGVFIKFR